MNCGKAKDLPTNTSKCGGILQRQQYMILKMSGYDLRLDYIFIGYEYNSSGY